MFTYFILGPFIKGPTSKTKIFLFRKINSHFIFNFEVVLKFILNICFIINYKIKAFVLKNVTWRRMLPSIESLEYLRQIGIDLNLIVKYAARKTNMNTKTHLFFYICAALIEVLWIFTYSSFYSARCCGLDIKSSFARRYVGDFYEWHANELAWRGEKKTFKTAFMN